MAIPAFSDVQDALAQLTDGQLLDAHVPDAINLHLHGQMTNAQLLEIALGAGADADDEEWDGCE